ncbi:SDR family NAD(P)-dependent oxidoreductase [Helicobacter sp.]|uniref:SDR family NAD(P)-dependent oxidoreductase n=1 Tax=Helicobacter sp. TaxID=218 RepID=UPI0025B8442F|nr:SDR family oxidoreductase [Helicobacter sp.]MCI5968202.1 SDR family oxidoreductase [Helicobacter sp.]MDY2585308.1 SDR family oxidoreductase [Helicobacter sp.]
MESLKPRALITGASSGIGLAIAQELHKEGYCVMLVARNATKLQSIKEKLKENVEIYPLDLMDTNALQDFLAFLQTHHLLPFVCVHNVGGRLSDDTQPLKLESFIDSVRLNLGIAVQINSYLLPLYAKAKKGQILHISSDSALDGYGASGYVASKAALNAYIKSTARFYAKDGVCINGVMPGIVEFPLSVWNQRKGSEVYKQALAKYPLGRFASLDEISSFVVALILQNNMQTTGQIYVLNGGK